MSNPDILATLGIDWIVGDQAFRSDPAGHLVAADGGRIVLAAAETLRGFHRALTAEDPAAWNVVMQTCGCRVGDDIAKGLEAFLAAARKPALAALPLEACLALLERTVAAFGWGFLKIDLTDAANHGFVVARLENSFGVEALAATDDAVDAMLAGVLQAFFTHISGQNLGCKEIASARGGATCGVFVITAPERLATLEPWIRREPAEALLARLRH